MLALRVTWVRSITLGIWLFQSSSNRKMMVSMPFVSSEGVWNLNSYLAAAPGLWGSGLR
jgi:hypothetical protein